MKPVEDVYFHFGPRLIRIVLCSETYQVMVLFLLCRRVFVLLMDANSPTALNLILTSTLWSPFIHPHSFIHTYLHTYIDFQYGTISAIFYWEAAGWYQGLLHACR